MRVVCIIHTVAIELRFVCKHDVTMQLATDISHLQNSSLSAKSPGPRCGTRCTWYGHMPLARSVLHTHVCGTRRRLAIFRVLTHGLLCIILFFIDAFINITLGCNAKAGKCTGISQCLVNWSKHSSDWYSTVRKMLLIFGYGMTELPSQKLYTLIISAYSAPENINGILAVTDALR